jgi:Epoxide hydrolase N terminus
MTIARLAELRRRIEATRWPSKELVSDRSQGVQLATLQALARYWTTDYDWRNAYAAARCHVLQSSVAVAYSGRPVGR